MSVRKIVKIDESKCNGCGKCVTSCAEKALAIIDGKARLVSDVYCDGLGACLGKCPMDAITIEERPAANFDENKVQEHLQEKAPKKKASPIPCACPGSAQRTIERKPSAVEDTAGEISSELTQWPVQLKLVSPSAGYLQGADILLTADCVPFAFADFHRKILRGKALLVGCPKLDDCEYYREKLIDILQTAKPRSVSVVHMEVPCCRALMAVMQDAILASAHKPTLKEIVISINGNIL